MSESTLSQNTSLAVASSEGEAVGVMGQCEHAMPSEVTDSRERTARKRRRSGLGAVAIAVIVVLAATWFSNARGVRDVATQGAAGVRAEAALSAAAVARNRVAQATIIQRAVALGVAPEEELAAVVSSTEAATRELQSRIIQLGGDLPGSSGALELLGNRLSATLSSTLSLVVEGGDQALLELRIDSSLGDVDAAFTAVATELVAIRDAAMNDMLIARDTAGQVAVASRLVVAFIIPLGAVLLYRFSSARASRRRELQRALAQEREMVQAKEELVANISHELRTPLTGILGFSQTAAMDDGLAVEDLRSMASLVAGEANELSRMVDDLITTARDNEDALTLVFESVNASDELDAVLIPATISGTSIATDVANTPMLADRLRLRQILRNLVSNALKYGGPNVSLKGEVQGDRYALSVIDDGDGVPEEIGDRLFTRFVHQGDAPLTTGSVGLGLAIAHRLAGMMNGTVTYSRLNDMTHFTLELPLAADETLPADPPSDPYAEWRHATTSRVDLSG